MASKDPLGNDPFASIEQSRESETQTAKQTTKKTAKKTASKATNKTKKKPAKKPVKNAADSAAGAKKPKTATKGKATNKGTKTSQATPKKTTTKPNQSKASTPPKKPRAKTSGPKEAKPKAASSKVEPTPRSATKAVPPASALKNVDETRTQPLAESTRDLVPLNRYAEAMADVDRELPRYDPALSGDPDSNRQLRSNEQDLGESFGFNQEQSQSLSALIQFLYRVYWRVDVEGAENIPDEGRALLVGNHSGVLPYDSLIVRHAVKMEHDRQRAVWPLLEDFMYYAPVLGTLLSKAGAIRACQENAQRLLKEDELVLVFPEGIKGIEKSNAKRYQLQRFGRGGYIKLCLMTHTPVIPVAIVGSEDVHPILSNIRLLAKSFNVPYFPITPTWPLLGPLGLLPLPAKWRIRFGDPIYVNQFDPDTANDRVAVQRLSNQVRETIQKMLKEMTGKQKSRWF